MQLRDQLGDVVQSDRSALQLSRPITCDVLEFRRLVSEDPDTAAAAEIPRFLAGFSLKGAPRFEEWAAATRRELLQSYQQLLESLARQAMGQWRWRDAAGLVERWLACDHL